MSATSHNPQAFTNTKVKGNKDNNKDFSVPLECLKRTVGQQKSQNKH